MESWVIIEILSCFKKYCKTKNYNRFFMLQLEETMLNLMNDMESFDAILEKMNELEEKQEKLTLKEDDTMETPEHYLRSGKDLFSCCEDGLVPDEEYIAFLKLNIFKYLLRYKSKNGLEDLYKAKTYLEKLIEIEQEQELMKQPMG